MKISQDRQGLRQERPATAGCLQAVEQRSRPFAPFALPEHCPKLRVAKCAARQDPIALPLQWSARSACSFLASAGLCGRQTTTSRRGRRWATTQSLILPTITPLPLSRRTTVLHEPFTRSSFHYSRPRTRQPAEAHDRPPSFVAAPSPAFHSRPRCSARRQRTSLTSLAVVPPVAARHEGTPPPARPPSRSLAQPVCACANMMCAVPPVDERGEGRPPSASHLHPSQGCDSHSAA